MTLNHDNIDSAVKEQLVISKRHNIGSLIVLILTNVLWGSSFILTKILTNNQIPIFFYIGLRFTIALLGFLPFVFRLKHITKSLLLTSLFTGFLYFFSILFQTYGLQYTTAGKAGFITGLGTVFVPFILFLAFKKPIKKKNLARCSFIYYRNGFSFIRRRINIGNFTLTPYWKHFSVSLCCIIRLLHRF